MFHFFHKEHCPGYDTEATISTDLVFIRLLSHIILVPFRYYKISFIISPHIKTGNHLKKRKKSIEKLPTRIVKSKDNNAVEETDFRY